MTREVLKPAQHKKTEVTDFLEQRCQELLQFAAEAATEQQGLALVALERVTEYLQVLQMGSDYPEAVARLSALIWGSNINTPQSVKAEAAGLYHQLGHSVPVALH